MTKFKQAEGVPNIVVPTIRDREFFSTFLENWKDEFSGCHLIVVEDRKRAKFRELVKWYAKENGFTYQVFDHRDIDKDLKEDSWIISRKTDCVRNYGYLVAYRNNPLFIVTLDDDLKPEKPGHIQEFYNNLFIPKKQSSNYFSTMNDGVLPRGKLTKGTEIVVSHGGWLNVPDFDAKTQILTQGNYKAIKDDFYRGIIPTGCYYSMCGMNLAWKPEFTKYMYFPLMGAEGGYPIDRCGDIWAGYYSKHKADEEGKSHYTGEPFCIHTRASNPWSNLKKEQGEAEYGNAFIEYIINNKNIVYREGYFNKLKVAYMIWESLISEAGDSVQ